VAKSLTVGSCTFLFPTQGQKSGWGEVLTDWACAVSTRLNAISGANDIDLTSACISNNQTSAANVGTGSATLSFSTSAVRSFDASYVVVRTDCCCAVTVEKGCMTGAWNGTAWAFSVFDITGCAGMSFSITAAGQVQYVSDSTKGTGTMKFTAKTFAQ
jgi:hypothetical protein